MIISVEYKEDTMFNLVIIHVFYNSLSNLGQIFIDSIESIYFSLRYISKLLDRMGVRHHFTYVIIDNCSNDNTYQVLRKMFIKLKRAFPKIHVVIFKLSKNYGYSGAICIALKLLERKNIKPTHVVWLNDDIIITKPRSLFRCLLIASHKNIGAVQPLTLWLFNKEFVDSQGVDLSIFGILTSPATSKNRKQWMIRWVYYVEGMFLVHRYNIKILGKNVKIMPPCFYNIFSEDLFLCQRLSMLGLYNVVVNTQGVYHGRGLATPGKYIKRSPLASYYSIRNRLLTLSLLPTPLVTLIMLGLSSQALLKYLFLGRNTRHYIKRSIADALRMRSELISIITKSSYGKSITRIGVKLLLMRIIYGSVNITSLIRTLSNILREIIMSRT